MTRRERLERKLEKREEWAGKAHERSDQAAGRVAAIAGNIPLGQPILVGHHSERRHRKDVERIHSGMRKACEQEKLAKHHESKAEGLAAQLGSTIFSDDGNAIEALKAKIAELEAFCERAKALNAAWKRWKKSGDPSELHGLGLTDERIIEIEKKTSAWWDKNPVTASKQTNKRAEIRRCKQRIVEIERRAKVAAAAEATENGVLIRERESSYFGVTTRYVIVTFAEKPERSIINALKSAGFDWSRGQWEGLAEALPDCVRELA